MPRQSRHWSHEQERLLVAAAVEAKFWIYSERSLAAFLVSQRMDPRNQHIQDQWITRIPILLLEISADEVELSIITGAIRILASFSVQPVGN